VGEFRKEGKKVKKGELDKTISEAVKAAKEK
jgi:hypothetical protein